MRVLLFMVAMIAGCVSASRSESVGNTDPHGDNAGGGASTSQCVYDLDCVPAAATCCECPTFAVNVNDPIHRACTGVTCPDKNTCSDNVSAICTEEGSCSLACKPVACPTESCATGFALDANGCLTCDCAVAVDGGCTASNQCVRTRADCCGCALGGDDTAVLAVDRAAFDALLMCPTSPACPGIDVCSPDEPQCVQGGCKLLPLGLPAGACGRPDLPSCPPDLVCTVNLSDQANMQGVGVCAPP